MSEHDAIIDMSRALGRAIQMDARYLALKKVRDENDADAALQELIGRFNLARMNLSNEVEKEERDDQKLAAMNIELQELYAEVMTAPGMQRYEVAKSSVEELFSHITAILTTAINGGDPDTVDAPECGCSGDCGGCSSCG